MHRSWPSLMKLDFSVIVDRILRRQCERIAHPMSDEHAGHVLQVTQCDDQLIDLSGSDRIQPGSRFVVQHDLGFADQARAP